MVARRVAGAIVTFFNGNILAIGVILVCGLGNTIFFTVMDER